MVIFLDLETEEAEKRGGYGEEKYEKKEMQQRVRKLFLDIPLMGTDESLDMHVINAGRSIEEVAKEVEEKVFPRVEKAEQGKLGPELRVVKAWPDGTLENLAARKKTVD